MDVLFKIENNNNNKNCLMNTVSDKTIFWKWRDKSFPGKSNKGKRPKWVWKLNVPEMFQEDLQTEIKPS